MFCIHCYNLLISLSLSFDLHYNLRWLRIFSRTVVANTKQHLVDLITNNSTGTQILVLYWRHSVYVVFIKSVLSLDGEPYMIYFFYSTQLFKMQFRSDIYCFLYELNSLFSTRKRIYMTSSGLALGEVDKTMVRRPTPPFFNLPKGQGAMKYLLREAGNPGDLHRKMF